MITSSVAKPTAKHTLRHIDKATFSPQAKDELMPAFFKRLKVAYGTSHAELVAIGKAHLLPHYHDA